MNNLDVAGILRTYSEKARYCKSKKKLQELVRDLKSEFNYEEIRKLHIIGE